MDKWISVYKELPKKGSVVITQLFDGSVGCSYYNMLDEFVDEDGDDEEVLYWQPLPNARVS